MEEIRNPSAGTPAASEREQIGIKRLLEWAFATECASLDFDETAETSGGAARSAGSEYAIMQMLALGTEPGIGVRPDTSFGRSLPHDDAEVVASVLRHSVPFGLAIRIAELARACQAPQWDLGQQYLQPKEWGKKTLHGHHGKTAVYRVVEYKQRGRKRRREEMYVPCHWVPSASQIASARRGYLDWWGGLLAVSSGLKAVQLTRFELSDRMPPMTPWRKEVDTTSKP